MDKEKEQKRDQKKEALKTDQKRRETVPEPITRDTKTDVLVRDDLDGLSEEGKEIFQTAKNVRQKIFDADEKNTSSLDSSPRRNRSELEDQLAHERIDTNTRQSTQSHPEYGLQLAKQPVEKLYHEMASLYHLAEEKGYLNQDEQRRVQYLASAVEQKVHDAEEHRYDMTEEAAAVAGITRQIGAKLRDLYKGSSEYHPQYRFN